MDQVKSILLFLIVELCVSAKCTAEPPAFRISQNQPDYLAIYKWAVKNNGIDSFRYYINESLSAGEVFSAPKSIKIYECRIIDVFDIPMIVARSDYGTYYKRTGDNAFYSCFARITPDGKMYFIPYIVVPEKYEEAWLEHEAVHVKQFLESDWVRGKYLKNLKTASEQDYLDFIKKEVLYSIKFEPEAYLVESRASAKAFDVELTKKKILFAIRSRIIKLHEIRPFSISKLWTIIEPELKTVVHDSMLKDTNVYEIFNVRFQEAIREGSFESWKRQLSSYNPDLSLEFTPP